MQKSSFWHRILYYTAIVSTIYSIFRSKIRLFGQAPRRLIKSLSVRTKTCRRPKWSLQIGVDLLRKREPIVTVDRDLRRGRELPPLLEDGRRTVGLNNADDERRRQENERGQREIASISDQHDFMILEQRGENPAGLTPLAVPEVQRYGDCFGPVVRNGAEGRELVMARWGMPSPKSVIEGRKSDPGVTNIRNVSSPHWRRWLGVENRCVVPFSSFSENEHLPDGSRPRYGSPLTRAVP